MAELVFIHGAGDSAAIWQLQIEHFGGRLPSFAVDLPGHGARLGEDPLETVADMAEDVIRQLGARGFGEPVLVGHSMGGAIALAIALQRPSFPRALVLAASGARLRMREELIEEARLRALRAPRGEVVERVIPLQEVVAPDATREAQEWLRGRFGCCTAQATYGDFLATSGFDVMGRLEEIHLPVLVVGGEEDRWTPPKFQHYFAQHLPNAQLVMFPRTGHYPFVEREAEFNRALDAFLAGLDD